MVELIPAIKLHISTCTYQFEGAGFFEIQQIVEGSDLV